MLKTRLATAAVALSAALAAILLAPAWLFSVFVGVLGAWGLYEVAAIRQLKIGLEARDLIIFGCLPLIWLLVRSGSARELWWIPIAVTVLMLALAGLVAVKGVDPRWSGVYSRLLNGLGAAWVGVMFPYFALLRNGRNGTMLAILVLLLVVATDSGAYFTGKSLGRHSLARSLSPHKTIEGSLGGLVVCVAAALLLRAWLVPDWALAPTVVFSAVVSVLAQLGDLANSAYKRIASVKDAGWILPGHGGLLDRTCSLVFAAVFTYYYAW